MVDSISNDSSYIFQDDKTKRGNGSDSKQNKPILIPIGGSNLAGSVGFVIGYNLGNATAEAIKELIQTSRDAKAAEVRLQQENRQHFIDSVIGGNNGDVDVGMVESEAKLKQIGDNKAKELKQALEAEGYRYGTYFRITGGYNEPNRSGTAQLGYQVVTSYEETVNKLNAQGYSKKNDDKFKLKDKDNNHSATLNIEGYDTVCVQEEVIDNKNDENKEFDAVKGSKLGKKDGEAEMKNENTIVQKYKNGAEVQTIYDDIDNPNLTITKTIYPDGSISVKTETNIPIKYGVGDPASENYVEGVLKKGTVVEQYTPDGELVYKKTKES